MRAFIDRSAAFVCRGPAVEERTPTIVGRLELHPHIERVDGAARKKVPYLASAHDDLNAHRLAPPYPCVDFTERRDHFRRRTHHLRAGAEVHRFFADSECARETRLCGGRLP